MIIIKNGEMRKIGLYSYFVLSLLLFLVQNGPHDPGASASARGGASLAASLRGGGSRLRGRPHPPNGG